MQIAIAASEEHPNSKLQEARRKWDELKAKAINPERRRFSYCEARTFDNPKFWRQLGHNPSYARRLAKCFPNIGSVEANVLGKKP